MKNQRRGIPDREDRHKNRKRNRNTRDSNTSNNQFPVKRNSRAYRRKKRKPYIFDCLIILAILIILFGGVLFASKYFQTNDNNISQSKGISTTDVSSIGTLKIELEELNSPNAILLKLQSGGKGETVAEKNADERIYPASLTKIMTAILAIEGIGNIKQQLEIPYSIFQYLYEMDASMAGFEPGETATAEELVYGMLLESGAECCLALADFIAGSEESYVKIMNQKAGELGMEDTNFCNTTGLQDKKHYTTVRDLSVLLEYALKNKEFRQIFTSISYTIEPTSLHPEGFTMQSTLFEKMENPEVEGGQILGGKTGYTEEAGLCLASLAEIDGQEYILVTVHAAGSHETEQFHIEDAVNVYNQIGEQLGQLN